MQMQWMTKKGNGIIFNGMYNVLLENSRYFRTCELKSDVLFQLVYVFDRIANYWKKREQQNVIAMNLTLLKRR